MKQTLFFGDEVTIDFSDKPEYTKYGNGFDFFYKEGTRFFVTNLDGDMEGIVNIKAIRNGIERDMPFIDPKRVKLK